jgi:hypothetical protein
MNRLSGTIASMALICAGCASSGPSPKSASSAYPTKTFVVVTNEHWLDVNVYALRGGVPFRLGTVRGLNSGRLSLPVALIEGGGSLRLLVDPIGSDDRYATESIAIRPGQWIDFRVANMLTVSSYSVWSR